MPRPKAFRYWPEEEKQKLTKKIIDYWMSDTELTMKDLIARFTMVNRQIVSDILNQTDDPPTLRAKRRGFSQQTLKGIKTPERKPFRYTY